MLSLSDRRNGRNGRNRKRKEAVCIHLFASPSLFIISVSQPLDFLSPFEGASMVDLPLSAPHRFHDEEGEKDGVTRFRSISLDDKQWMFMCIHKSDRHESIRTR